MIEIHPNLHPVLVHYTVALYSTASVLLLLSKIISSEKIKGWLFKAGLINLWMGAVFSIATVWAGFDAFGTVVHDAASHEAMKNHRNWAVGTAILYWILTLWSVLFLCKKKSLGIFFIIIICVATLPLIITGYKGANLVYVHGTGVMSLPNADQHHEQALEQALEQEQKHDHEHHQKQKHEH